jgi:tungstate transport system ATP-binding protein
VLEIDRLTLAPASITGLVGPNGSGKSTLLKLMAFVQRPSGGRIWFDGAEAQPFDETVRFQVTLLTQEPYLMKRTVFANIAYGLKVRGDRGDWSGPVNEALTLVGLKPDRFAQRPWNELSGGEAQRVALAARLVLKPRVLLLDEPTASVDAASSELIRLASLNARSKWGTTLVIASHDREWLYDICDRVVHLFKGKRVASGRTNTLFGPWIDAGKGHFHKPLGDGQRLLVSPPPAADAAAFLDPAAIQLFPPDSATPTGEMARVAGRVTRWALEKETGGMIADVRVGNLTLAVRVDASRLEVMRPEPGRPVILVYAPTRIRWC